MQGRVAIVTGAARGIGAAVARTLLAKRATILLAELHGPAYLASDAAAYVNGQVITIDGGLTAAGVVTP